MNIPQIGFRYLRKSFRGLSYLAFVFAGFVGLFFPSVVITELAGQHFSEAWSFMFFVSASICFTGVIIQNWVVEYIGLPLLSVVFFIYSVSLLLSVGPEAYHLLTFSLVSLGVSIHLFSRYHELKNYLNK